LKQAERYHPERYRISRPFVKQAVSLYRNFTGITTITNSDTTNAMQSLLRDYYNHELSLLPFEQRPSNTQNLVNQYSLAMHYSVWSCHGKQIFHFGDEITQQFRHTDIDQIQIGLIKLPYNAFYMSFGIQNDLPIGNNQNFVDGAYISVIPNELIQIVLTTNTTATRKKLSSDWATIRDRYYFLTLSLKEPSQTISDILEKYLENDLAKNKESLEKAQETINIDGVEIKNRRRENIKVEIAELLEGFPICREALKLVINGLCYLSAYPDDVELRWSDDTPKPLLNKINSATKAKEVQRTTSKLTSMGYTKINYCGKSFEIKQSLVLGGNNELRTHWRRGHWRNQPYGLNLSQRKIIWIMPVMVKKEKLDSTEESGHIYLM
jgi:hypothetical protein